MAQLRFFAALKVFQRSSLFNTCASYIQLLLFIVSNDTDLFDHFLHTVLSVSAALSMVPAVLTIQRCHRSVPIIHAADIYSFLYLRVITAGLLRYNL